MTLPVEQSSCDHYSAEQSTCMTLCTPPEQHTSCMGAFREPPSMPGMHAAVLGRPTYLTIPSVQHIAQLDHHSVSSTPEGPPVPILFKHPRNLQGGDCLLQVPMDVPDCASNKSLYRLALVTQKVIRRP